jgi:hypothetical protein
MRDAMDQGVGSQRLLEAASKGDVLDRCLFMPLVTATGAAGNSSALVGSPETVAEALLDYYDIGVTTFLIRGYDPFDDVAGYAELVIVTTVRGPPPARRPLPPGQDGGRRDRWPNLLRGRLRRVSGPFPTGVAAVAALIDSRPTGIAVRLNLPAGTPSSPSLSRVT